MCLDCEEEAVSHLEPGDRLSTPLGHSFTITEVDREYADEEGRGRVDFEADEGEEGFVHVEHLADCFHRMREEGYSVRGVDGREDSVRDLVGRQGRFVRCSVCDDNAEFLWAMLYRNPSVKLGYGPHFLLIRKRE